MLRHYFTVGFACCVSLLTACGSASDPPVDIGDGEIGQQLSDYAATWTGYAEAFAFTDGSDKIRLLLDEEGQGTLEVGESAHFPEATSTSLAPLTGVATNELSVSFAYQVQLASIEASRLRFQLNAEDVYADWCSQQTPVLFNPTIPDMYACRRDVSIRGGAGPEDCEAELEPNVWTPVDCGKVRLCSDLCQCTATSCSTQAYTPESGRLLVVDGALTDSGNTLEGTLITGGNPVTIRLTRE